MVVGVCSGDYHSHGDRDDGDAGGDDDGDGDRGGDDGDEDGTDDGDCDFDDDDGDRGGIRDDTPRTMCKPIVADPVPSLVVVR